MGIRLNEAGYYDLKPHIGHKIVVVGYGNPEESPVNVAIECETCGEVLVDFEQPCFEEAVNGELVCSECGGGMYCDDHPEEGDGEMYCIVEGCENAKPDWGSIGPPS